MIIYISHSSGFNFKDELYKPLRESKLNNVHEIILPHEFSNKPLKISREFIKSLDLIIAEVSFPSTGSGIELGWAYYLDKRIICIYKKGYKYSNSLKLISNEFIEYDSKNLVKKIIESL